MDAGPTGKCTALGPPFTIMSSTDIGSPTFGDSGLLVVPDPGPPTGRGAVHVSLVSQMNDLWLVRSVNDQMTGNPVGPLLTFGASPPCTQSSDCQSGVCNIGPGTCNPIRFTPVAGWPNPGMEVHFQGYLGSNYATTQPGLGEFLISMDPNNEWAQVTPTPPTATTNPLPSDCVQGVGFPSRMAFQGGAKSPYAVVCKKQNVAMGMPDSSLWVGALDGSTPNVVGQGMKNDALMNPMLYNTLSGVPFIEYQSIGSMNMLGSAFYGYGANPANLSTMLPLTVVANQSSLALGVTPLTTNDGFVLFLGSIDVTTGNASIWAGPVKTADFANLKTTPPPTLQKAATIANALTDLGLGVPLADTNNVWMAGPTFDKKQVLLSWFKRDGTPLLMGWSVYTAPMTNGVIYAAAAPMGIATLVVWVEQLPNNMYQMTGQKLVCQHM
jgi:hypothetical protein